MFTNATRLLCVVAGLAIFGIGLASAGAPDDMAALQAVDQTWLKANNAGDADTMASLYDEQAVLMPPGVSAVTGREAIRAFLADFSAESVKGGFVMSFGPNPAGGVSGDMGWQSGSYAVKDPSGVVVDTGKFLSVSVKKGGKWLYVRDIWNSDGPPAPAASTATAEQ
jgi:ketosteroid isomerase-like protein